MKQSKWEKVFHVANDLFLAFIALLCVLPVVHIFPRAFSSAAAIGTGKVLFWPVGFHTKGITYILEYTEFLRSLYNSLLITVLGTIIALFCTILTAFALSHAKWRLLTRSSNRESIFAS